MLRLPGGHPQPPQSRSRLLHRPRSHARRPQRGSLLLLPVSRRPTRLLPLQTQQHRPRRRRCSLLQPLPGRCSRRS
eukprot:1025219-Rhodomonas_salina.1